MPHLPGLDGLRGVALAIVLLYHHGVTWMTGGELTVSMFFTLSGFLITRLVVNEWAKSGVNVNAIAPGYIKTKLNQHVWKDPEREKAVLARLTSGRWGNPEDLVGPTLFLSSHAADYLHGVILPVDGGWLSR